MKNVNRYAMCMLLILISACFGFSSAYAQNLTFGWEYPEDAASKIEGFRLYRDGQIIEQDNIPPTATTVTVPRPTDRKAHSYNIVAFVGKDLSGFSDSAIDVPVITVQAVGPLTIQIVD